MADPTGPIAGREPAPLLVDIAKEYVRHAVGADLIRVLVAGPVGDEPPRSDRFSLFDGS